MIHHISRFRPAIGLATLLAGTALLAGCADPPARITRTTTEQTTTTAPTPPAVTTMTTTNQTAQP